MSVRRDRSRAIAALLAVAGALLGHELGYGVVGASGSAIHTYVGPAASVLVPLGALGLVVLALRAARDDGEVSVTRRSLAASMTAVYLLQELAERIAFGEGFDVSAVVPVVAGLLAQPVVASVLVWLIGLVARGVAALTDLSTALPAGRTQLVVVPVRSRRARSVHLRRPSSRGPPRF